MRDVTELAREVARQICLAHDISPDQRDGCGMYNWEWYLDEARKIVQLVTNWEGNHGKR